MPAFNDEAAPPVPAPALSDNEIYTKELFIQELQNEIARITRKTQTGNQQDRSAKIAAFNQLKIDIEATLQTQPLLTIMKEFFARNYTLITLQRGGGLKMLFNPDKPQSLTMLERFYNPTTCNH